MRMKLARPSASLGTRERERRLADIAGIIDRDELDEALSRLQDFLATYPDDKMAHLLKASVHDEMEDYELCEQEASWLLKRYPDCPDCNEMWVSSAVSAAMFAVAIQRSNQCFKRWPNRPYIVKLAETMREIEEGVRSDIADFCSVPANWLELAAADDEAQFLMEHLHVDEAIEVCLNVLKKAPEYIPIRNTLALCRLEVGQIDEARRDFEGLLDVSGTPAAALRGLVKIGMLQGRYAEAKELARRMRTECDHDWSKFVADSLCLAGEFAGMCEYYEELATTSAKLAPVFKHGAAAAYARLGNNAKAQELWKEVLKEEPSFAQAKHNLSDMREPAGTRKGPWSHSLEDYLPLALWHDISQVLSGDPDLAVEWWQTLRSEWPEFLNIAPIVLERGDDLSRRIALAVLLNDDIKNHKEVLLCFASGHDGSDQLRAGVYFFMAEAALLAPGTYTFWHNGEAREIPLFELPSLSSIAKLSQSESDTIAAEAYAALSEERYAEARDGFMNALAMDPNSPVLQNNLAAAYKGLGDEQKYIEIISDLFDDHPNYVFARTNMALIQMEVGNLDAARGLLKPLSEKNAFRPTEYEAVYTALIRLATLEGDKDEAARWVDVLEQAVPTSEMVTNWKQHLMSTRDFGAPRSRGKKKRYAHAQKTLS